MREQLHQGCLGRILRLRPTQESRGEAAKNRQQGEKDRVEGLSISVCQTAEIPLELLSSLLVHPVTLLDQLQQPGKPQPQHAAAFSAAHSTPGDVSATANAIMT
jgi:hypothetical protein